jgi:hypothetical protein
VKHHFLRVERCGPAPSSGPRGGFSRLFRIFFLFLLPAAFQTSYQLSGGTGQPLTAGSWFFFNFNGSERKKSSKKNNSINKKSFILNKIEHS